MLPDDPGDLQAVPEPAWDLLRSMGEGTTDKDPNLGVALQKGITAPAAEARRRSSNPDRVGTGTINVPAFSYKTKHQNLQLPPIPPILNPTLQSQAFTHSACLDASQTDSHSAASLSYERLEFIGDAYIECIASRIVYARFPYSLPGKLSQIRESLVKNETLAGYAISYGFDRTLKIPRKVREAMTPKTWTKTLGDVFEAYVAAVVLSSPETGFSEAEAWLSMLWEDKLVEQAGTELNQHAKAELMRKLMGKGIKIEFREEREPQILKKEGKSRFFIGAYLRGWGWENQHLGSGVGFSKGEAGIRAAMQALANVPLVDEIAAVKKAYDEEVRAKRELENS
jgi:ribonuclease III